MQGRVGPGRLLVVSNRLPLTLYNGEDGQWHARASSGGLVRAMLPVLQDRGGVWIGWPGITPGANPGANPDITPGANPDANPDDPEQIRPVLAAVGRQSGFDYQPVHLTLEEQRGFYEGFSNEIIWPLFHDLVTYCHFDAGYWDIYERVNRKFTRALERVCQPTDLVWVHDYHLMQVAYFLRQQGRHARIGFFLHIPFPSPEIFMKLPWRFQILRGLAAYDVLGFQTTRDRRNFLDCMQTLHEFSTRGRGAVLGLRVNDQRLGLPRNGGPGPTREIRVGSFPIGIDDAQFNDLARSESVRTQARWLADNSHSQQMVLGVDRLDYTKGLPQKVDAFANVLERYPELCGRLTLVQHVVPSRLNIPDYHRLRSELEQKISAVNGRFSQAGWVPIHYMFHSLPLDTLIAYYQAADIALITPPKDGMNLVAKEFCAARSSGDGVLILSEFAGSAVQLQDGALLVNPYDVEGVADALYRAFKMPPAERRERMQRLRRAVRGHDVFHWADTFLATLSGQRLGHFPVPGDYIPREQ